MLKLQRNSREGTISVIIRDKEYLLTRPFLLALAIAIGIHLGLILLFHIAPFNIDFNERVLTPTQVQADNTGESIIIAELAPTAPSIRGLPPVPSSYPSLSQPPKFLAYRPIAHRKIDNQANVAFTKIEQKIYVPEFIPTLHRALQSPFQIAVSGILGDYTLITDGMENQIIPKSKTGSTRIIYSVLVEGRTGKIFWFEPSQHAHEAAIDKFAEKILRKMKFASDPKAIAISGSIEMQFNEEA